MNISEMDYLDTSVVRQGNHASPTDTAWFQEVNRKLSEAPGTTTGKAAAALRNIVLSVRRRLGNYDVFLCYNNQDKDVVLQIGRHLLDNHVLPWVDAWNLRPGSVWIDELDHIAAGSPKFGGKSQIALSSGHA